ncbi:MAG TPA: tetratricopeptide repeat protein [Polyangiaceae bacterium]
MRRVLTVAALALAWPNSVLAQSAGTDETLPGAAESESREDVARARDQFRLASALARSERWSEALALYAESYRSYPHATTLYNLGYCHEKLGDPAAAYRDTLAALVLTEREPLRGLTTERRSNAEIALATLRGRTAAVSLPSTREALVVSVDGGALVAVEIGGQEYWFPAREEPSPQADLTRGGTLVLNPGRHRMEVRGAGDTQTLDLLLASGTTTVFAWPERRAEPVTKPPEPVTHESSPPPPIAPRPKSEAAKPTLRPWAISSFALAGTGVLAALVSGVVAANAADDLRRVCSSQGGCPESARATIDRFETASTVANVGVIVAACGAVAGVTLLILEGPSRSSAPAGTVRVSPAGHVQLDARF